MYFSHTFLFLALSKVTLLILNFLFSNPSLSTSHRHAAQLLSTCCYLAWCFGRSSEGWASVGQHGCSIIFIHSPSRYSPAQSEKEGQTVSEGKDLMRSPPRLHYIPRPTSSLLVQTLNCAASPLRLSWTCVHQAHSAIFKWPDSLVYDTRSSHLLPVSSI